MWLAIVLFALWFLNTVSMILAPFVVSLIFAYMLNPIVVFFQGENSAMGYFACAHSFIYHKYNTRYIFRASSSIDTV